MKNIFLNLFDRKKKFIYKGELKKYFEYLESKCDKENLKKDQGQTNH